MSLPDDFINSYNNAYKDQDSNLPEQDQVIQSANSAGKTGGWKCGWLSGFFTAMRIRIFSSSDKSVAQKIYNRFVTGDQDEKAITKEAATLLWLSNSQVIELNNLIKLKHPKDAKKERAENIIEHAIYFTLQAKDIRGEHELVKAYLSLRVGAAAAQAMGGTASGVGKSPQASPATALQGSAAATATSAARVAAARAAAPAGPRSAEEALLQSVIKVTVQRTEPTYTALGAKPTEEPYQVQLEVQSADDSTEQLQDIQRALGQKAKGTYTVSHEEGEGLRVRLHFIDDKGGMQEVPFEVTQDKKCKAGNQTYPTFEAFMGYVQSKQPNVSLCPAPLRLAQASTLQTFERYYTAPGSAVEFAEVFETFNVPNSAFVMRTVVRNEQAALRDEIERLQKKIQDEEAMVGRSPTAGGLVDAYKLGHAKDTSVQGLSDADLLERALKETGQKRTGLEQKIALEKQGGQSRTKQEILKREKTEAEQKGETGLTDQTLLARGIERRARDSLQTQRGADYQVLGQPTLDDPDTGKKLFAWKEGISVQEGGEIKHGMGGQRRFENARSLFNNWGMSEKEFLYDAIARTESTAHTIEAARKSLERVPGNAYLLWQSEQPTRTYITVHRGQDFDTYVVVSSASGFVLRRDQEEIPVTRELTHFVKQRFGVPAVAQVIRQLQLQGTKRALAEQLGNRLEVRENPDMKNRIARLTHVKPTDQDMCYTLTGGPGTIEGNWETLVLSCGRPEFEGGLIGGWLKEKTFKDIKPATYEVRMSPQGDISLRSATGGRWFRNSDEFLSYLNSMTAVASLEAKSATAEQRRADIEAAFTTFKREVTTRGAFVESPEFALQTLDYAARSLGEHAKNHCLFIRERGTDNIVAMFKDENVKTNRLQFTITPDGLKKKDGSATTVEAVLSENNLQPLASLNNQIETRNALLQQVKGCEGFVADAKEKLAPHTTLLGALDKRVYALSISKDDKNVEQVNICYVRGGNVVRLPIDTTSPAALEKLRGFLGNPAKLEEELCKRSALPDLGRSWPVAKDQIAALEQLHEQKGKDVRDTQGYLDEQTAQSKLQSVARSLDKSKTGGAWVASPDASSLPKTFIGFRSGTRTGPFEKFHVGILNTDGTVADHVVSINPFTQDLETKDQKCATLNDLVRALGGDPERNYSALVQEITPLEPQKPQGAPLVSPPSAMTVAAAPAQVVQQKPALQSTVVAAPAENAVDLSKLVFTNNILANVSMLIENKALYSEIVEKRISKDEARQLLAKIQSTAVPTKKADIDNARSNIEIWLTPKTAEYEEGASLIQALLDHSRFTRK